MFITFEIFRDLQMIQKNNRKRGNMLTFARGMKKQYSKSFPLENMKLDTRAKSRIILIPLFFDLGGFGFFYRLILPRYNHFSPSSY